jgi:hypothetical protein
MFRALRGLVALLAYFHSAIAPSDAIAVVSEPEFCRLRFFERIYVLNDSDDIQRPRAIFNHCKFICCQGTAFDDFLSSAALGPTSFLERAGALGVSGKRAPLGIG